MKAKLFACAKPAITILLFGHIFRNIDFHRFGAIGIKPESCITLGLLTSIVIVLSSLPGGIVYSFFRNRNDVQQLAAFETEFS
jgi:hypothetical protein